MKKKETLKRQLERAIQDNEWKTSRINELLGKLEAYERKEKNKMFRLEQDRIDAVDSNKNLLEIIRWQINPETAKYPFRSEKGQREDRDNR